MAIEMKKNGSRNFILASSKNFFHHSNQRWNPNEKNLANLIKLDILMRKYENIVDKNAIEEVFKSKKLIRIDLNLNFIKSQKSF